MAGQGATAPADHRQCRRRRSSTVLIRTRNSVGGVQPRRVRVVEFWEKTPRGWTYCYFVGEVMLDGGVSPQYLDDEGKPDCPYVAWSPYVDEGATVTARSAAHEADAGRGEPSPVQAAHPSTAAALLRRGTLEDVEMGAIGTREARRHDLSTTEIGVLLKSGYYFRYKAPSPILELFLK